MKTGSPDILIVGGGIVGFCTAYSLVDEGYSVAIVDRGDFTDNCSFGNAGMIVPSHFIPLASPGMIRKGMSWMMNKKSPFYIRPKFEINLLQWVWQFYRNSNKTHVEECSLLLKEMHRESRDWYQTIASKHSIDWREDGILMLYRSDAAAEDEIETAKKAHSLNIPAEILNEQQVHFKEPLLSGNIKGGIWYPLDATLDPAKTMKVLFQILESRGVKFISNKEVEHVIDHQEKGSEVIFKDNNRMTAKYVVVSTGSWSGNLTKRKLLIEPGKGYSFDLPNNKFSPSIASILHEARVAITPMGDFTRIGGTLDLGNFSNEINRNRVEGIVKSIPQYYQSTSLEFPSNIWHGLRPCSPDGMPFIGKYQDKSSLIIATGHAMMGMSLAPSTARMVVDIVKGNSRRTPHSKLDPGRFNS